MEVTMTFKEVMAAIFSTAEGTFYKWKRENRPIISLLETYFNKEELEEFLKTGKISKMETLNRVEELYLRQKDLYFSNMYKVIFSKNGIDTIAQLDEAVLRFYFQYLYFLKSNFQEFGPQQKPFSAAAMAFSLQHHLDITANEDLKLIFNFIAYLDSEPSMLFYFEYLLQDDLSHFLKRFKDKKIQLEDFQKDGKVIDNKLKIDGWDDNEAIITFYLYHCYNNIAPYSEDEIQPFLDRITSEI